MSRSQETRSTVIKAAVTYLGSSDHICQSPQHHSAALVSIRLVVYTKIQLLYTIKDSVFVCLFVHGKFFCSSLFFYQNIKNYHRNTIKRPQFCSNITYHGYSYFIETTSEIYRTKYLCYSYPIL